MDQVNIENMAFSPRRLSLSSPTPKAESLLGSPNTPMKPAKASLASRSGARGEKELAGDNEPAGFVLTAILGIVGAFVATFLGQALGWYGPGEGAGLIGAVVGAIIVLFVYGLVAGRQRAI
jgi:uncharacterized membrane protein YeaQ/YmgE (transglycosylase-associated protein family)